jgi:hypothetical protein
MSGALFLLERIDVGLEDPDLFLEVVGNVVQELGDDIVLRGRNVFENADVALGLFLSRPSISLSCLLTYP